MLGIALLCLAAAAAAVTGLDRLLARIAVRRMSALVGPALGVRTAAGPETAAGPAAVRIAGVPFLTQLAAGRYREVEITAPGMRAGGIEFRGLTARLSMVRAPLRQVLAGRGLVAGQVSALATIPFTEIASRLPAGLTVRPEGDELRVFGFLLLMPVTGTLAVRADGQRIWVVPKVLGVPSLVAFVIPLTALPAELTIDSLRVTDGGLEVSMRGENVNLGPR